MNIKKLNHFDNKSLLAIFGAAIVACTSLYSVSAHESGEDSAQQKKVYKFVHKDGDDEKHQVREIKIIKDDKTFVDEDGDKYVVDGDAKRAMTAEELKTFEQDIEQAQAHQMVSKTMMGGKHGDGDKQIKIIRKHEGGELSEEDIEILTQEMQDMQIEMEMHQDEFSMAQHEIKMAEKDIEAAQAANQLSDADAKKVRKKLEKAAEKLANEQQRMQKTMEQARADIKRVRTEILESKAH